MLIGDLLRRAAEKAPDKLAVDGGGERIDYARLDADANRFAQALAALGIGPGGRIAILASNRPGYAAAYFGAARSGAVLAHLSFRFTEDDIVYMLGKTDVEAVLVEEAYLKRILRVRDRLPGLRHVVVFGADAAAPKGVLSLAALMADAPDTQPSAAIGADDPFAITFTGGTTGLPKAVLVSHKARLTAANIAVADFGLDGDDIFAITTPLFHSAGLFVWYQAAVALAASCHFMPTWDAGAFVDLVEQKGVSAAFLVPTQLGDLLGAEGFDPARLDNLKKLNFAGAPMPPTLFERALGLLPGVEFTEHYGQSEACPITVRKPASPAGKRASVGRACTGTEIAIMDGDGGLLPPGEVGDVVTRGDTLLSEYYGDPEQTAALYRDGGADGGKGADGWLLTGDVGIIDGDGYLTLVDRSKDMIISGGENIYPTEIENTLYTHRAVVECAVFGVPDERWGEIPVAHVVVRDGVAVSEEELIDHCAARIARHKRPRSIKFVDALPKTAVGKIQKSLIRAPYWEGRERKI